jgi:hypothetical protein
VGAGRQELRVAADEPESGRAKVWADLRIDPVEIALPGGVGHTLRAYRPATGPVGETTTADDEAGVDDYDAAAAAVMRRRLTETPEQEAAGDHLEEDEELSEDELADLTDEETEAEAAVVAEEDVPLFLGRRGRLYLFHSPEKLVEFVRTADEHDLNQLDSWAELVDQITPEDVVALPEDTYELDLVVENLRGGADAWDAPLILRAGELARDVGYALRLPAVLAAMGTGSPLDDLDEALRAAEHGGVSGFIARRRLRKIPAQQSALAWRTVIGKISAAVDWRD